VLALSSRPQTFFPPFRGSNAASARLHYGAEVAVHLVEFGVFFVLATRALRFHGMRGAARLAVGFGMVVALSFANESIQAFTPTRMFDLEDVLVDAVGGIVGGCWVVTRRRE